MPEISVLASQLAGQELQREFNWEFWLPDLPGSGVQATDLIPFCQAVKFGDYNMTDLPRVKYGSFKRGYAGFFEVNPMVAEFLMGAPDLVNQYFTYWKSLIITPDGFYSPKSAYAFSCYVKFFDTTGDLVETYQLSGAFPKTFPGYDLGYAKAEIVKYPIEFNVDSVNQL